MNLFDRIILLATGLVAIYMLFRFYEDQRRSKSTHNIYYMISFAVLLVAGLLLIIFTYDALANPLVVIAGALIPLGISLGLVDEFFPKYSKGYLVFAVVGFLAIAITRFVGSEGLGTVVLIVFHSIAGLIVLGVPFLVSRQGKAPGAFAWVSVGGLLIDAGGVALAFYKNGKQFLFFSGDVIFAVLAPLLLLMALAFTWGFVKKLFVERAA